MSHNLIQPEELDHILMLAAGRDIEGDTLTPQDVQLSGSIKNAERGEVAKPGYVHQKSKEHGLSGP